jgi:hypothetical protein
MVSPAASSSSPASSSSSALAWLAAWRGIALRTVAPEYSCSLPVFIAHNRRTRRIDRHLRDARDRAEWVSRAAYAA